MTRPASQTDIYRYDIGPTRMSRLTRTPASEYSPTVMPDGAHISVVLVERDGRGRLWSVGIDGQGPALLLPAITPVGDYVWIDDRTVALIRPVECATGPELVWTPDDALLMACAGTLYRWRAPEPGWTAVADLEALGLRDVTRLAISPAGDRLALVGRPR
ncbi:MAG: hypothetical protein ABI818_03125 [Acidobacteriota bacterium]